MNLIRLNVTKPEQDAIHKFCQSKRIGVSDFVFQAVKAEMKRFGTNIREAEI